MHVTVSGGATNVQTGILLEELKDRGVPTRLVNQYAVSCVIPKKYGKVSPSWLDNARMKDEYLSSFASVLLSLMPIVHAFCIDCVVVHGVMSDHVECFGLMVSILGLLSSGADDAVGHLDLLDDLIGRHHALWLNLYGARGITPKWHHMLHLAETYRRLRKVPSCFAAERKHRSAKKAALHVFRHLEYTTLADMLNQQCAQIRDDPELFQRCFLVSPQRHVELPGCILNRATAAVLECGHIHADDVLWMSNGVVAGARCCWQSAGMLGGESAFVAECTLCAHEPGDKYKESTEALFIQIEYVMDAVAYRPLVDGVIRAI